MQYYRDGPALENNNNDFDFPNNNNSNSNNNKTNINNNSILFKVKQQITGKTVNSVTNDVEIMVQLKYLRNFWRNFEIPLINWETNLQLKWPEKIYFSSCNCNKSRTRI